MNIHEISTDRQGGVVYWDASPVRKDVLDGAYTEFGLANQLPRRMKRATALRMAMSDYIEANRNGRKRTRIDLNPLDRRVCGFEAVLQNKGDEQNQHAYQFTAKVNTANETVRVTSGGVSLGQTADDYMTHRYQQHLLYYCGSTVGALLKRAVLEWRGTSLKGRGGVYFLPDAAIDKYRDLDSRFTASGAACQLHVIRFPIGKDDATTRSVIGGFRDEVRSLIEELNCDLLGDTEMRERGVSTRITRLTEAREKIAFYCDLFSVSLDDLREAVDTTTTAIKMARLTQISA
jgi:hypothetical protein